MYYARFYVVKANGELSYDDQGFLKSDTLNPAHLEFSIPANAVKIDFYDETRKQVVQRAFLQGEVLSETGIAYLGNYDAYMATHGATHCIFAEGLNKPFLANENDLVRDPETGSYGRVSELAALLELEEESQPITKTRGRRYQEGEPVEDEGEVVPDIPPPDIRDRITPQIVPVDQEKTPEPTYIPGVHFPIPKV